MRGLAALKLVQKQTQSPARCTPRSPAAELVDWPERHVQVLAFDNGYQVRHQEIQGAITEEYPLAIAQFDSSLH